MYHNNCNGAFITIHTTMATSKKITKKLLLTVSVFQQMQGLNLLDGNTTTKLYANNKIYVSGKEITLTTEEAKIFVDMITTNKEHFVRDCGEGMKLKSQVVMERFAKLHFAPELLDYIYDRPLYEPLWLKSFLND